MATLTYARAWSRDEIRDARAFVFQHQAISGWTCAQATPQLIDEWFTRIVSTSDESSLVYFTAIDDLGVLRGVHVSTTQAEDSQGAQHWRRVLTVAIDEQYDRFAMLQNLAIPFLAEMPADATYVTTMDQVVRDATQHLGVMQNTSVRPLTNHPMGPTTLELIGAPINPLPEYMPI